MTLAAATSSSHSQRVPWFVYLTNGSAQKKMKQSIIALSVVTPYQTSTQSLILTMPWTVFQTSKWFSALDLGRGYYQIAMAEEGKGKTAFICPLGFYQFERMPWSITGVPVTFQRLIEKDIGDMHLFWDLFTSTTLSSLERLLRNITSAS